MPATQKRASAFRLIIAIGVVSLFADMTYEGARSVVGPFSERLGRSATDVLTLENIRKVFDVQPTFVSVASGMHLVFD